MDTHDDHDRADSGPGNDYTCMMCGAVFTLQDGEQDFYVQRGLSLPKRCVPCRAERKAQSLREQSRSAPKKQATTTQVRCKHCKRLTIIPFIPQEGSEVYCRICWEGVKNVGVTGAVYV